MSRCEFVHRFSIPWGLAARVPLVYHRTTFHETLFRELLQFRVVGRWQATTFGLLVSSENKQKKNASLGEEGVRMTSPFLGSEHAWNMGVEWEGRFELFRAKGVSSVNSGIFITGIVTHISDTCSSCRLRVDDAEEETPVTLPWERRSEHLGAVVEHCTAFRVRFDAVGGVVARATLEIAPVLFEEQMSHGRLDGEVFLVGLLSSCWRELSILPHSHETPLLEDADDAPEDDPMCPDSTLQLRGHQQRSLEWMRTVEQLSTLAPLRYAGNLRITDTWYVDTEEECLTTNPSWREAHVRGGVLADWAGAGKTAVVLTHCQLPPRSQPVQHRPLAARGSLIVVPLNLTSQWMQEVERFCKPTTSVCRMTSVADLRSTCLDDLLKADIVITTFQFLRDSRPYAHVVEDTVSVSLGIDRRLARTRAALCAYARSPAVRQPIIEAIHWRRIVLDEMHESLVNTRSVKLLGGISSDLCWGITATPDTHTVESAQQHYWLLQREKAHHPNMLDELLQRCIRRTRRQGDTLYDSRRMKLVALPGCNDERRNIELLRESSEPLARIVQTCTLPQQLTDDVEVWDVQEMLDREEQVLQTLRDKLAGTGPAQRHRVEADVQAQASRLQFVRDRTSSLISADEMCAVCGSAVCGVMLDCAHTFCRRCIERWREQGHSTCPICRREQALSAHGVSRGGTKLSHIADMCLRIGEPIIVFTQWKAMIRSMRALFRGRGIKTYTLEGNSSQRQKALREFEQGGVLVLNLNDSFAGLHLPHVRWIFFSHAIVADRQLVRAIEYQAIARCIRHGQTQHVRVYSFVVADSEEEALWHSTHDDSGGV